MNRHGTLDDFDGTRKRESGTKQPGTSSRAHALLRRDVPVSHGTHRGTQNPGHGTRIGDSDVHSVPVTGKALGQGHGLTNADLGRWEEEGGAIRRTRVAQPRREFLPLGDEFPDTEPGPAVCVHCLEHHPADWRRYEDETLGGSTVCMAPGELVPSIGDVVFVWLGMYTRQITWTFFAVITAGVAYGWGAAIWRGVRGWFA
jgi:hypothetical protein